MTKLVGILNVTPDSFSDGGRYSDVDSQIAALEALIAQGADVVDIGAESTRPGAAPLSAAEEWERLAPFFSALRPAHLAATLSLDTRHAENAKRALDKGFRWINDVSGFTQRAMIDTVGGYHCTCVVMHSLTVPADKNVTLPEACDVIEVLKIWVADIRERISGNIIIDPGIGFGKTAAQSWEIIERIGELKLLGFPLLVGHSRKSFLRSSPSRGEGVDLATLAVSRRLITAGVNYLRVHDVTAHRVLLEEPFILSEALAEPKDPRPLAGDPSTLVGISKL